MADVVKHDLVVGTALDVQRFTHKSLLVHPDAAGNYSVKVSNDGNTFVEIASTGVGSDTFLRDGPAATDLPTVCKFIRVDELAAGAAPTFSFVGHDPV
jgi:hypothetical protein